MKLKIKAGTTSKRIKVYVQDSSGAGKTGVTHNHISGSFIKESSISSGTLPLNNTGSLGSYVANTWVETSLPGLYEYHIPNGIIDTSAGASVVIMFQANGSTATGMLPVLVEIELDRIDYQSSSYAKLEASASTIVQGNPVAGTLSFTEMTTDLTETTDDHYNGRVLIFTSGVLAGQATDITDYDGASKKLTFTALSDQPATGGQLTSFVIV